MGARVSALEEERDKLAGELGEAAAGSAEERDQLALELAAAQEAPRRKLEEVTAVRDALAEEADKLRTDAESAGAAAEELAQLEEKLAGKEKEAQELQRAVDVTMARHSSQLELLEKRDERLEVLQQHFAQVSGERDEVVASLGEVTAELDTVKADLSEIEALRAESLTTSARLAELQLVAEEVEELRDGLEAALGKAAKSADEVKELSSGLEEAHKTAARSAGEVEELSSGLKEAHKLAAKSASEVEAARAEAVAVEEAAKQKVAEMKKELKGGREHVVALEQAAQEKEELAKVIDQLQDELVGVRVALNEKEADSAQAHAAGQFEAEKKELERKVFVLKSRLAQKEDLFRVFEEEMQDTGRLREEVSSTIERNHQLEEQSSSYEARFRHERSLFRELEENYKGTIMDLNNEKEDALIRLSELEERARKLETALQDVRETAQSLGRFAGVASEARRKMQGLLQQERVES